PGARIFATVWKSHSRKLFTVKPYQSLCRLPSPVKLARDRGPGLGLSQRCVPLVRDTDECARSKVFSQSKEHCRIATAEEKSSPTPANPVAAPAAFRASAVFHSIFRPALRTGQGSVSAAKAKPEPREALRAIFTSLFQLGRTPSSGGTAQISLAAFQSLWSRR